MSQSQQIISRSALRKNDIQQKDPTNRPFFPLTPPEKPGSLGPFIILISFSTEEGNHRPTTEHRNWRSFIQNMILSIQLATVSLNRPSALALNILPWDACSGETQAPRQRPLPKQTQYIKTAPRTKPAVR